MFSRILFGGAVLAALLSGARAQVALDRPAQVPPVRPLLADAFDFPVGQPDGRGYYKARGFRLSTHPGEDWDGLGGGNSDFNDAVSSIADGLVIFAQDARRGWGNVVIVRHQFREEGATKTIDALYGHLNTMRVARGEAIRRGQQIGTVGTAHGCYAAHLHFEIRKNLGIGINRAAFPCDFSCYYDPTKFIAAHRRIGANALTLPLAGATNGSSGLYACNRVLTLPPGGGAPVGPRTASRAKFDPLAALLY